MIKLKLNPDGLVNKKYQPFLFADQSTQIYFGGSSSGKSVFLGDRTVWDVLMGRNYLIVRNVANTIKKSCWNEVCKSISRQGLTSLFNINKSEMTITALCNRKQILFSGLDDSEKVKSITPLNGPLTDVWIEEATEISYQDYKQLRKRLRGASKHKKRITLSFNPIYQTHWIYQEFFGLWVDGVDILNEEDLLIVKSTHKDNEFLTEDDHYQLEHEQDPYYYQVYTLGNWGVLGDCIFKNWRVADLYELVDAVVNGKTIKIPLCETFDNVRNGVDFGFASDPCAYLRVHIDKKRRKLYVFKEYYERGKTNLQLADDLKPIIGYERIACDSAEPKSIQELKDCGINAFGCKKGKDSILFGIQWLQNYEIIIDKSCQNLKNELTLYQWKKDKDGNTVKQPIDKNNHLIDALRYALSEDMDSVRGGMADY